MLVFPPKVEIPKYEKYDANIDPQDHFREFCALHREFLHETMYLITLFP